MSRSTYVYLVQTPAGPGVVAAYTVKREMVAWLRREISVGSSVLPHCQVKRLLDGQPHVAAVSMGTVAELLKKEDPDGE